MVFLSSTFHRWKNFHLTLSLFLRWSCTITIKRFQMVHLNDWMLCKKRRRDSRHPCGDRLLQTILPYFKILGGRFIGHGKVENFEVTKVRDDIFSGIDNFYLKDELYIHELNQASKSISRQNMKAGMCRWSGRIDMAKARSAMLSPGTHRERWEIPLSANVAARIGMGDRMNKLNLAIVGCGDIAGFTALVSRLVPQVTLSACCDVNAERAQSFAKRHRIPQVFTDYNELLEKSSADAVYLAVPHHLHYEMILSAVECRQTCLRGKTYHTDTRRKEKNSSKQLQTRKSASITSIATTVDVMRWRGQSNPARWGKSIPSASTFPGIAKQNYFDGAAWHKTIAQAGGGTLITQGSHFLDVALWALGETPVSAMGYAATSALRCGSGHTGARHRRNGRRDTHQRSIQHGRGDRAKGHDRSVWRTRHGDVHGPSVSACQIRWRERCTRNARPNGVFMLYREVWQDLRNGSLDDKPFLTPAASTLPVLAAVDGIYRSASSGQKSKIDNPSFDL